MTAQFPDQFLLDGQTYAVVGVNGDELFDPAAFDLHPMSRCTACWRGYVCRYALKGDALVLDQLKTSLFALEEGQLRKTPGPAIHGVTPTAPTDEHAIFNTLYQNLDLPIQFTGRLLIGDEFIQSRQVHMGFHPAWKYAVVLELTFDAGTLIQTKDVSQAMAQVRKKMGANE